MRSDGYHTASQFSKQASSMMDLTNHLQQFNGLVNRWSVEITCGDDFEVRG
jgi:hypothetical protein